MKSLSIIAGPCSAESCEQVLLTANFLQQFPQVQFFRAGVWKPRSSPHSFQGQGAKALKWLTRVETETRLTVLTEVASVAHLNLAIQTGLTHFWLGARTVGHPFSVQEIVDAAQKNKDLVFFLKNPIHADLALWKGAVERFQQAGLQQLRLIHRGFSVYQHMGLRNSPLWHIPIEMKLHYPKLPLVTDPSHMAGKRAMIPGLAQKAIDMGAEGLMLEVHPDPSRALSDSQQQLSFSQFEELLQQLKPRQLEGSSSLEHLRTDIDLLDRQVLKTLEERMRLVDKLALLKQQENLRPFQLERFKQILTERQKWSTLDSDFVEKLFQLIHTESLRSQV